MRFMCLDRSGGILQYNPQKVAAFFVAHVHVKKRVCAHVHIKKRVCARALRSHAKCPGFSSRKSDHPMLTYPADMEQH